MIDLAIAFKYIKKIEKKFVSRFHQSGASAQ